MGQRSTVNQIFNSTLIKSITANYLGTIIALLIPLIAIPLYVDYLGDRAWGLVSTLLLIQSILYLSEAGIGQLSSVAFSRITKGNVDSFRVIKEYEVIYWLLPLGLLILTSLVATFSIWLNLVNKYTDDEFALVTVGAGVLFFVQFPGAMYKSILMNNGRQLDYNRLLIFFTLSRHGVILLVVSWFPTVYVYLIFNVLFTLAETLARRARSFEGYTKTNFVVSIYEVMRLYSRNLRPAVVVLIGMLTTQIDKIMASFVLNPEQYGRYALASTVSQGILTITQPIIQGMSPQILQSNVYNDSRLQTTRKLLTYLLLINAVLLLGFFTIGKLVISIWLGSSLMSIEVYSYLHLLVLGCVLNSIYHVFYYNFLADNSIRLIFKINVIGLLMSLTVTPLVISFFGEHWLGLAFLIPNATAILLAILSKRLLI